MPTDDSTSPWHARAVYRGRRRHPGLWPTSGPPPGEHATGGRSSPVHPPSLGPGPRPRGLHSEIQRFSPSLSPIEHRRSPHSQPSALVSLHRVMNGLEALPLRRKISEPPTRRSHPTPQLYGLPLELKIKFHLVLAAIRFWDVHIQATSIDRKAFEADHVPP